MLSTLTLGRHARCSLEPALAMLRAVIAWSREQDTAGVRLTLRACTSQASARSSSARWSTRLVSDKAALVRVHTKVSPHVTRLNRTRIKGQVERDAQDAGHAAQGGPLRFELGLRNFASWDVVRTDALCRSRGWVRPAVYQLHSTF